MHAQRLFTIALVPILVALAAPARSAVIKELDFNVDGVLPSSDPNIDFFNSSALAEGDVFAVAGGLLEQRTAGIGFGNTSYNSTGILLDSTMATRMTARLQVLQIETAPPEEGGGVFFQALDGANRYSLFFDATGVQVLTAAGIVSLVLDTSVFHTYRLQSPGSGDTVQLFVDGALFFTSTAPATTLNFFGWGDGISSSGNNGDADWDFVRVSQVPEPALALFVGIGLLALAARGSRRPA